MPPSDGLIRHLHRPRRLVDIPCPPEELVVRHAHDPSIDAVVGRSRLFAESSARWVQVTGVGNPHVRTSTALRGIRGGFIERGLCETAPEPRGASALEGGLARQATSHARPTLGARNRRGITHFGGQRVTLTATAAGFTSCEPGRLVDAAPGSSAFCYTAGAG